MLIRGRKTVWVPFETRMGGARSGRERLLLDGVVGPAAPLFLSENGDRKPFATHPSDDLHGVIGEPSVLVAHRDYETFYRFSSSRNIRRLQ